MVRAWRRRRRHSSQIVDKRIRIGTGVVLTTPHHTQPVCDLHRDGLLRLRDTYTLRVVVVDHLDAVHYYVVLIAVQLPRHTDCDGDVVHPWVQRVLEHVVTAIVVVDVRVQRLVQAADVLVACLHNALPDVLALPADAGVWVVSLPAHFEPRLAVDVQRVCRRAAGRVLEVDVEGCRWRGGGQHQLRWCRDAALEVQPQLVAQRHECVVVARPVRHTLRNAEGGHVSSSQGARLRLFLPVRKPQIPDHMI